MRRPTHVVIPNELMWFTAAWAFLQPYGGSAAVLLPYSFIALAAGWFQVIRRGLTPRRLLYCLLAGMLWLLLFYLTFVPVKAVME